MGPRREAADAACRSAAVLATAAVALAATFAWGGVVSPPEGSGSLASPPRAGAAAFQRPAHRAKAQRLVRNGLLPRLRLDGLRHTNTKIKSRYEDKFVYSDLDPDKVRRHEGDDGPRRIVLCLDASEPSSHALDWCKKKLFLKEDEVHLLHIFDWDPPAAVVNTDGELDRHLLTCSPTDTIHFTRPTDVVPVHSVIREYKEMELREEQVAVEMMKEHQRRLEEANLLSTRPTVTVMRGISTREICDYVANHKADLLVMASRGLGAVKRFFLGSVSGYCAHNAKVPILIVKDDAYDEANEKADEGEAVQAKPERRQQYQ